MTQYILNVTTQKQSQYLLITFVGNFKKYRAFADGGYCGRNESVLFEYSHNILGWEIVLTLFSIFWKNSAYSDSGKFWYSGHVTNIYLAYTGSVQGFLSPVTPPIPAAAVQRWNLAIVRMKVWKKGRSQTCAKSTAVGCYSAAIPSLTEPRTSSTPFSSIPMGPTTGTHCHHIPTGIFCITSKSSATTTSLFHVPYLQRCPLTSMGYQCAPFHWNLKNTRSGWDRPGIFRPSTL